MIIAEIVIRTQMFGKGFSLGSSATQNRWDCLRKNLEVETQGPVINIFQVLSHPGIEILVIATIDLPQAGDPGFHAKAAFQPERLKALHIAQREWTRTHQAHIAFDDVEELGELVQTQLAEDMSQGDDTWIIFDFEDRAVGFISSFKGWLEVFGVGNHGAELDHPEGPTVIANSGLDEKDWTIGRQVFNQEGNKEKQG
jgi:hypothetical protein